MVESAPRIALAKVPQHRDAISRGIAQRGAQLPEVTHNYFQAIFDRFDRVCRDLQLDRSPFGLSDEQETVRNLVGRTGTGDIFRLNGRGLLSISSPAVFATAEKELARVTAAIDIVGELTQAMEISAKNIPGLDRSRMENAVFAVYNSLPDRALEPTGGKDKDYRFNAQAITAEPWERLPVLILNKLYDIPPCDA